MSIIKGCLKLAGSAVLAATGTASAVLKGVSDAAGVGLGTELFGAMQDASFNGIRNIWSENEEFIDKVETNVDSAASTIGEGARKKFADTAYRAAQIAKQNGDMEKYEMYMEKYEQNK